MSKKDPRDKPLMQTTMEEHAKKEFPKGKKKTIIHMPDQKLIGVDKDRTKVQEAQINKEHWDKQAKLVKQYNENLTNLDEDYKQFVPHKDLVVRAFYKDYEERNGILMVPKVNQLVMTQNGVGFLEPEESPFVFKNLVVVVAVPEGYEKYKPGDILQVTWNLVLPVPKQKNDTNRNVLPNSFTLHTYQEITPPENIEDKHFGYFLADPYNQIVGKVLKN